MSSDYNFKEFGVFDVRITNRRIEFGEEFLRKNRLLNQSAVAVCLELDTGVPLFQFMPRDKTRNTRDLKEAPQGRAVTIPTAVLLPKGAFALERVKGISHTFRVTGQRMYTKTRKRSK